MTWHIYATRMAEPALRGGGIDSRDWLDLIDADDSLVAVPSAAGRSFATRWGTADLVWDDGAIRASDPDDDTICKLWDIAERLGAHIEDDEGGWYDRNGIYQGTVADVARSA